VTEFTKVKSSNFRVGIVEFIIFFGTREPLKHSFHARTSLKTQEELILITFYNTKISDNIAE
jgi:hypothetical protein